MYTAEKKEVRTDESNEILSEIELAFLDSASIGEGMCSCVCINDEQCCGCPMQ
jgi:hypothetical protein